MAFRGGPDPDLVKPYVPASLAQARISDIPVSCLKLIMKSVAGRHGTGVSRGGQNALELGFHCVRTHWIRGFMAFQLARRTRIVRLMVPV